MEIIKSIISAFQKHKYLEYAGIVFILLVLTAIFYPKVFFGGHILSSADFLYIWEPWNSLLQNPYAPGNYVISDLVEAGYPLSHYILTALREGDLPLWYSLTGMGAATGITFIASYTVNPILMITSFLNNFDIGTTLSTSSIIFTLIRGLFTYLLLREYKLKRLAALFGAIVSSFALYNIVWGLDTLSFVSSMIPVVLLASELIFKKVTKLHILFFIISTILLLLGGFPSTIVYSISFIGLYIIAKSIYRLIKKTEKFKEIISRVGLFLFLGIMSAAVIGVILIPSVEIFTEKFDLSYRFNSTGGFFDKSYILRYFIPNLFGNPINYNWQSPPFQPSKPSNYSETAMYIGSLSLFLTSFSFLKAKKDKKVFFFAIIALLTFSIVFNIGPFLELIRNLPFFNSNVNTRLVLILSTTLTFLSAYGFDSLLTVRKTSFVKFYLLVVTIVAINTSGALLFFTGRFTNGLTSFDSRVLFEIGKYFFFVINGFFIIYLFFYSKINRYFLSFALTILVFLDLFMTGKGYLPQVKKENFYPQTQATEYLQKESENNYFRILTLDEVFLSATPAFYGLNSITSMSHYDVRWVEFMNLIQPDAIKLSRQTVRFRNYKTNFTDQVLDFANVRFVLDHKDSEPLWERPIAEVKDFNDSILLKQSDTVEQTINLVAPVDITKVVIRINESILVDNTSLLAELINEKGIVVKTIQFEDMGVGYTMVPDLITGNDIPSAGKYRFRLRWSSPTLNTVSVGIADVDLYQEGSLYKNNEIQNADLTFSIFSNDKLIEEQYRLTYDGEIKIYENIDFLERAFLVHKIVEATNAEDSLGKFKSLAENYELDETVVIESNNKKLNLLECNDRANDKVQIEEYKSNYVKIKTTSKCDSVLVLTDLYDKDWKVYVNGKEKDLYRADYLARAVYLPEGENDIKFLYKPESFAWGARISIVATISMIIFVLPFRKIFKKK